MADESGPAGVAKGLQRSLDARMWTGQDWARVGDLLAAWLVPAATQGLSRPDARMVEQSLRTALLLGPSADQIYRLVLRHG